MTLRKTSTWAAAFTLGLLLASCGGGGHADQQGATADTLAIPEDGDGLVKVGDKLFSIPSPVQTAILIRELKAPYASDLPFSTDSIARFATKEKQALALGVYGADLAYVAIHKDGQRSMKTLKAIEQLSGKLNLSNAFDKDLMEGFKKNINNEDSLLRFTGKAFRAADMYLKNDQRNDVSAGVLAGGWIEGLYLTLGSTGEKVDPKIATRLAEQRHTLDNLIALLGQNEASSELVAALKDLATSYEGVSSSYKFVQPTLDAGNKTTYINSVTNAEVSPEALQTIIRKVRAIRSSIIA
ncbi:MAG: hypothetical protein WBB32_13820 [Flavobacteriales bacterium]|nr:hypothetical protein [Flavobacteriales bacterium]